MARAFVHFALAFLLIAVHSCLAFPSTIHEKMTRVERWATFGSADSVPEYEVFSMSLPGGQRKREANENINLEIDMYGEKIQLDLKPARRYLASRNTPVWLAKRDEKAYNEIRYDLLPTAMSDIGTFEMYHDVEHGAAVIVYEDPVEGTVMEGIFDNFYVIRSLPSRLMRELLKVEGYVLKAPDSVNRSAVPDSQDGKGYYAVFKLPTAPIGVKNSGIVDEDGQDQNVSKAVYPEILIAIDYSVLRGHNLTQVLRSTLAFWNGVDLIYRALGKPKIYLNIAGIIVNWDNSTTPYMGKVVSTQPVYANRVLSGMGKYFYCERHRFPLNRYDIIIAMTALPLYTLNNGIRQFGEGYKLRKTTACSFAPTSLKTKTIGNIGIVRYNWELYNVREAAKVIAHLLGVKKNMFDNTVPDCPTEGGQIITNKFCLGKLEKHWSERNRKDFCRYFASRKSWCLHYKPFYIKHAGKVLPGRWPTLDGQCQNEGYTMACKLENIPTCAAKGCSDSVTGECVPSKRKPLLGTKCGHHKHCRTDDKCV